MTIPLEIWISPEGNFLINRNQGSIALGIVLFCISAFELLWTTESANNRSGITMSIMLKWHTSSNEDQQDSFITLVYISRASRWYCRHINTTSRKSACTQ